MELKCPIRSIDLPGVQDIALRGLIVVVGANSSGKTQFLQDLNEVVLGHQRKLVVVSKVILNEPLPFDDHLSYLANAKYIRLKKEDEYLKSLQYGADIGGGSFRGSNLRAQHGQFVRSASLPIVDTFQEHKFLQEIGAVYCSALFLRNRLTLMDACNNFDQLSNAPSKTLQSLHWNKKAKAALFEEVAKVFRRAIWVDGMRHNMLVVRVSDSDVMPSAADRLEPEIMETYRTIESEGDGLRSYAAICATILLGQRPLCLVDEPEMCLHPPQALAMGRFIGANVSESDCTIVATHSTHVLRGILESKPRAHVIRLSHVNSTFQARRMTPDDLERVTSKPRPRSESILEGLFANGVVICEAEGDRVVYETAYRTIKDRRLDLRLVSSEGTGCNRRSAGLFWQQGESG